MPTTTAPSQIVGRAHWHANTGQLRNEHFLLTADHVVREMDQATFTLVSARADGNIQMRLLSPSAGREDVAFCQSALFQPIRNRVILKGWTGARHDGQLRPPPPNHRNLVLPTDGSFYRGNIIPRLQLDQPLRGARLCLRPVVPADADGPYLRWMQDAEVLRFLVARFSPPQSSAELRAYVERMAGDPDAAFLAITLRDSGRHIGNIKLERIDMQWGIGEIGILIGEKSCWGRGYATEAISLLSEHAFAAWNLRDLGAGFESENTRSKRAFEKAGFMIEGDCAQRLRGVSSLHKR